MQLVAKIIFRSIFLISYITFSELRLQIIENDRMVRMMEKLNISVAEPEPAPVVDRNEKPIENAKSDGLKRKKRSVDVLNPDRYVSQLNIPIAEPRLVVKEEKLVEKVKSEGLRRKKRSTDVFNPKSLCIVIDEQFAASHDLNDRSAVISTLYKMIDRVSWIYRNIDWNGDGTPDNFGFEITDLVLDWKPFPGESQEDYDTPKPSMELLAKFAELDFKSCCLGVGITNRPFEENHVGVSFIADHKLLGGICDYRAPPTQPKISSNSALISGRGVGGSVLSLEDVQSVLIHELGHAFGVLKHDRDIVGSPECSGFLLNDTNEVIPPDYLADTAEPPKGRYIMWGQELQGSMALKENHLKFSPCSTRAVMDVFNNQDGRTSCLKMDRAPFCGNGILEYPEECDCGNEISCSENKCCGPRGSSDPCKLFKGINKEECVFTKVVNKVSNGSIAQNGGISSFGKEFAKQFPVTTAYYINLFDFLIFHFAMLMCSYVVEWILCVY